MFLNQKMKDAIDNDDIDLLLLELSQMSVYIRQDLLQNSPRDMDNLETIREAILQSNKNLDIE